MAGISTVRGVENSRTAPPGWSRRTVRRGGRDGSGGRLPPTGCEEWIRYARSRRILPINQRVNQRISKGSRWPNRPRPRSSSTPIPTRSWRSSATSAPTPSGPRGSSGPTWSRRAPRAGPTRSSSSSTSSPIKDEYTLAYTWDGYDEVTWTLVSGKMLRALDGAYTLRALGPGSTEVTYRLALDVSHPADRHAQAQGREDPHRHRAQGPEEARRVARLSAGGRHRAHPPLHRQGRRRQVDGRRRHRGTRRAAGHRTLVLSTDAAHSLADAFGAPVGPEPTEVAERLFVQQVDAQLRFEQSWAEIQGYLLSVLDVAGVDPVAAEELTVIPGAEEVLALLELRLHALSERVGRHRRRLRADGRDAAAAGAAGGARVVHAAGVPGRAPGRPGAQAGAVPGGRRTDARGLGLRRGRAAAPRARRGARAALRSRLQRPAGADPGDGGAGRGPALATRRCRCSATASTASWPTASSRPRVPTTGGPAG